MSITKVRDRIKLILEGSDDGSGYYYRITGFHGSDVEIDAGTPLKDAFDEYRLYADANPGRTLNFEQSEDGLVWEKVSYPIKKPQTLEQWMAALTDEHPRKQQAEHAYRMLRLAQDRMHGRDEETYRKQLRQLGAPV